MKGTFIDGLKNGSVQENMKYRLGSIQYRAYLAQLDEIGKQIEKVNDWTRNHPESLDDNEIEEKYQGLHSLYTQTAAALKQHMDEVGIPGSESVITRYGELY